MGVALRHLYDLSLGGNLSKLGRKIQEKSGCDEIKGSTQRGGRHACIGASHVHPSSTPPLPLHPFNFVPLPIPSRGGRECLNFNPARRVSRAHTQANARRLLVRGLAAVSCLVAGRRMLAMRKPWHHFYDWLLSFQDINWAVHQPFPIRDDENRSSEAFCEDVLASAPVRAAVQGLAGRLGEGIDAESARADAMRRANERARKIVSDMAGFISPSSIRFLGWSLRKVWRRLFAHGVQSKGIEELRGAAVLGSGPKNGKPANIVYIPTHKSHLDYLILSHILFTNKLKVPFIAAGDNLNIPLVSMLLRSSGAFFISRSKQATPELQALYDAIFKSYIQTFLSDGHAMEFFIEGGRSRDGRVRKPKHGVLSVVVASVLKGIIPDAVLVPVSIDYEKVLESEQMARYALGSKKKAESLAGAINACMSTWMYTALGGAHVTFGSPISVLDAVRAASLDANTTEDTKKARADDEGDQGRRLRRAVTGALAARVYAVQKRLVVVTATNIVSVVLLSFEGAVAASWADLVRRASVLVTAMFNAKVSAGSKGDDLGPGHNHALFEFGFRYVQDDSKSLRNALAEAAGLLAVAGAVRVLSRKGGRQVHISATACASSICGAFRDGTFVSADGRLGKAHLEYYAMDLKDRLDDAGIRV